MRFLNLHNDLQALALRQEIIGVRASKGRASWLNVRSISRKIDEFVRVRELEKEFKPERIGFAERVARAKRNFSDDLKKAHEIFLQSPKSVSDYDRFTRAVSEARIRAHIRVAPPKGKDPENEQLYLDYTNGIDETAERVNKDAYNLLPASTKDHWNDAFNLHDMERLDVVQENLGSRGTQTAKNDEKKEKKEKDEQENKEPEIPPPTNEEEANRLFAEAERAEQIAQENYEEYCARCLNEYGEHDPRSFPTQQDYQYEITRQKALSVEYRRDAERYAERAKMTPNSPIERDKKIRDPRAGEYIRFINRLREPLNKTRVTDDIMQ
jgi:hypothetical protein